MASFYCSSNNCQKKKKQKKGLEISKNICLYETGKVAVPVRTMSSSVQWRLILHVYFHVLREPYDT